MAATAEQIAAAKAAGYMTPTGDDLIANGDNAISNNAGLAFAASYDKGLIPLHSNLDNMHATGHYSVDRTSRAETLTNWPPYLLDWPGHLEVMGSTNGMTVQRATGYGSRHSLWERAVVSVTSNLWSDWEKIWPLDIPEPAAGGVDPYTEHSIRQTQMVYNLGGPIDTGGLGAVAFRVDHAWAPFKEKLLPIFRAAGIVPMVTYNPRDWDRAENAGVTPAEVNQWVADGWIEISNHGATHSNATGEAAITDFVENSLAEIEAELPAAAGKVYGFCVPGVPDSNPYGGFRNGNGPAEWGTFMGKTILKNHAVGYGYLPGGTHLRILDGTIRDGQNHITLDSIDSTRAKTYIDQAISRRRGLQLMIHPSLLDTDGKITTAHMQEIVDYIVAKRDAGQIMPLSSYQMMIADSTRTAGGEQSRDTGWVSTIPTGALVDPADPGTVDYRRIGDEVFCRLNGVSMLAGASNGWLAPNGIPAGFTIGSRGTIVDVPGGYANVDGVDRNARHRLSVQENDIAYIGYLHNWNGTAVEPARDNGSRRVFGYLPSWITDDQFPA